MLFKKILDNSISKISGWIFDYFLNYWITEKATVVIPALNEQKTIAKVIKAALKSRFVGEIIVVDDGSTDKTAEIANSFQKVVTVSHKRNLGKGQAIITGIKNSSNEIIFFLDADLQNISTKKINSLLLPLLRKEADFVKAGFSLKRGRVTEIAVKPMMKILFPKNDFSQPISGQFGARKSFLSQIKMTEKWGVDIAIFLEALKKGLRVVEVNIGELSHKAQSTGEKAEMSRQVMETMLKKAGVFADYFQAIVFSENALFEGEKPKRDAEKIISRLKKRKFKTVLFAYDSSEKAKKKATELGIDYCITANSADEGLILLGKFKKAARKLGLEIGRICLIASKPNEAILLNAAGYGITLGKDKILKKRANKTIESLSEILLLEE